MRSRVGLSVFDWTRITVIALLVAGSAADSLAREVTCAVVPASDSEEDLTPLIDSLEVVLSRSGDLAVLARTEMEQILAERSISLGHGGHLSEDYKTFGAILRAELLVFLYGRRVEKKGVLLEFEIVETKHGIRLFAEDFAWDGRCVSMADTLAERVIAARERIALPIKHVFAVPAFECTDLLYTPAALGRALAGIARRTIERVDAAVVVDVEHASEIAAELSITNGSDRIERGLPFYVIGQYHHIGNGDERRLAMELILRHGSTLMGKYDIQSLSLDAAGPAVTSVVERMLVESINAQARMSDSVQTQREADLLAKRAEELASFTEWVQAIDLAESALLLDPTRNRLHLRIAKWCSRFVRIDGRMLCRNLENKPVPSGTRPQEFFLDPERKRRYALLALGHLRRYAVNGPLDSDLVNTVTPLFGATAILNYDWEKDACDFRQRQRLIIKEKIDVFLRILLKNESRLCERREAPILSNLASAGAWIVREWAPYTANERLDTLHRVLVALSRFKYGYEAQLRLLLESFSINLGDEQVRAFSHCVEQLATEDDLQSKLTAEIVGTIFDIGHIEEEQNAKREIDRLLANAYSDEPVAELPSFGIHCLLQRHLKTLGKKRPYAVQGNFCSDEEGVLTAIALKMADGSPVPSFRDIATWGGIFQCGDGVDIIHAARSLYAMRQPGILKPIPPPAGERWRWSSVVVSDGRYIWIADPHLDNPIVVLDGDTLAIVASFGPTQGLPPIERFGVKIAPIRTGQVCAVGTFGRTWIATLTFDPSRPIHARKQVDVFHEAREDWRSHRSSIRERTRNMDLSFYPQLAQRIGGEQSDHPLVYVGRGFSAGRMSALDDVILADPVKRTVRPLPVDWTHSRSYVIPDGQRLIRIFHEYRGRHARYLQVLRSPDFAPTESIELDPPAFPADGFGEFIVDGDAIHLIQNHELATIHLAEQKIVIRCGLTKRQSRFGARLAQTSHYGLVVYSDAGMWRVRLPESN